MSFQVIESCAIHETTVHAGRYPHGARIIGEYQQQDVMQNPA